MKKQVNFTPGKCQECGKEITEASDEFCWVDAEKRGVKTEDNIVCKACFKRIANEEAQYPYDNS